MIKKRRLIFLFLAVLLLIILIIVSSSVLGLLIPQSGKQVGDLSVIESYKGTSRLFLELFVGCLREQDGNYIGAIPHYNSSLLLDQKINFPDEKIYPTPKFNTPWGTDDDNDGFLEEIIGNGIEEIPKLEVPWQQAPKSYLYEGNCYLFANYWHQFWNKGEEVTQNDEAFSVLKEDELYNDDGDKTKINAVAQIDESKGLEAPFKGAYYVSSDDYSYNVYWEGTQDSEKTCENYGGYYKDVGGNKVKNCCGDDYLWIMNSVYNFDGDKEGKSVDELCLYGYVDPDTGEPLVESSESQIYHTSAKVGNHPYRNQIYCTPLAAVGEVSDIHYSYDINNYDPQSTTEQRRLFVYNKDSPTTTATDVGLWKTDTSANYCTHYFSDKTNGEVKKGDNFEWLTPEKAGEINYFGVGNGGATAFDKDNKPSIINKKFILNPKAPDYIYDVMTKQLSGDNYTDSDDFTICNLFLGGTWTGHHCCGNKYKDGTKLLENFNDEGTASSIDTEKGEHYVLTKNRLKAYSLSAEIESGEVWKEPNKACYQGEAMESGEIRNTPNKLSIINKKGELNLCYNIDGQIDGLQAITGKSYDFEQFKESDNNYLFNNDPLTKDNVISSCGSFYLKAGDDLVSTNNRFAYCFTNNTWLSFDIMPEDYAEGTNPEFDILGRYPAEGDVLHESGINDDFKLIKNMKVKSDKGCCFQGDCWNGNSCTANGATVIDKYVDPKKVYLCANGEWTSGEASFNWYDEKFAGETDPSQTGLAYCVDKWSCACPEKDAYNLGDEDQHEIDICETYTQPNSQCTREPAMFIGDRFCEPEFVKKDGDGYDFKDASTITSSQWTSRTTYLATALLTLAQQKSSNEFTLQCDTPKSVLNFYNLDFAKDLFVTEQDYNNFCALKLKNSDGDEEIYLGTTLNPQLKYDEIPEELYQTKEISEFEQCTDDTNCIQCTEDDTNCIGYGCYKKPAANVGQCVKQCYDDSDCDEGEECFTAEEVPEGEIKIGLCAPTSAKDVDMFNIENLGELFYGTSDTTGLLNNEFLFKLTSKKFAEDECKTILEGTNPQNGNGDDFLLFKTCDNDNIAFNNFTKAMIFSNNSQDENFLTLTYDEVTNNNLINNVKDIKDYYKYEDNKDKIAEKKEMDIINSISDLDKIYYARKEDGDKTIFGVLERKSDPDASGDPSSKLRYFAVIMYKNIFTDNKVCTELEKTSPLLYCGYKDYGNGATTVVIIIPSTPDYDGTEDAVMNYWPDLTAKIRLK
ncbi:hypothetical protein HY636_04350 [Candidatus Woesearchaeota archaeon]|nr:hypothetical protein [Candidatus Woesearchaeota archaeon]